GNVPASRRHLARVRRAGARVGRVKAREAGAQTHHDALDLERCVIGSLANLDTRYKGPASRRHVARVADSPRSSPRLSRQGHHAQRNIPRIVSHGEPTPVSSSTFGVVRPVSPPGPVVTRVRMPTPKVARRSRPPNMFS